MSVASEISQRLGKTLSPVIMGCAQLTDRKMLLPSTQAMKQGLKWLDDVFAEGCNVFDTALVYQLGGSERVLGQWMQERANRDEVVLLSKGGHPTPFQSRRLHAEALQADLDSSLKRLQTDSIDVYMLHRDVPSMPVSEIMPTLHTMVTSGKVRVLGASNWTFERVAEANRYAREQGYTPFSISSPQYSLATWNQAPWGGCMSLSGPDLEDARIGYAREGISIWSWSSLAAGFFSSQFLRGDKPAWSRSSWENACLRTYANPDNYERLSRATSLAAKKDVSVAQIALAYITSHDALDVKPILYTRRMTSLRENCAAVSMQLTAQEREWLDLRSAELL